ncbi:MAG: c-type cytochrome [Blastocatellia bacterium]|nr:c-type cytochrome [Blastocatellia bacterium]
MTRRLLPIAILGLAFSFAFSSGLLSRTASAEQEKGKAAGSVAEGRKLFTRNCASCHGADGKGGGPVAKNLKTAPPDLTRIEKVDGKFPTDRIQQQIQGETMTTSHGTREMPVWGSVFRRQAGEGFAKLEIYNLTKYLESIQQ